MTPERLRSILRLIDSNPAQAEAVRELLDRVRVTDDDIRAFGLGNPDVLEDSPRVVAWCRANGITLVRKSVIEHGVLHCSAMACDWIINALAEEVDRSPLVVLGEIAKAK